MQRSSTPYDTCVIAVIDGHVFLCYTVTQEIPPPLYCCDPVNHLGIRSEVMHGAYWDSGVGRGIFAGHVFLCEIVTQEKKNSTVAMTTEEGLQSTI